MIKNQKLKNGGKENWTLICRDMSLRLQFGQIKLILSLTKNGVSLHYTSQFSPLWCLSLKAPAGGASSLTKETSIALSNVIIVLVCNIYSTVVEIYKSSYWRIMKFDEVQCFHFLCATK